MLNVRNYLNIPLDSRDLQPCRSATHLAQHVLAWHTADHTAESEPYHLTTTLDRQRALVGWSSCQRLGMQHPVL